jgi:hypothetical protein
MCRLPSHCCSSNSIPQSGIIDTANGCKHDAPSQADRWHAAGERCGLVLGRQGDAVSRQLSHASSSDADAVKLTMGRGGLSDYIRSLKLGRMLKYEYVPEFQGALYAPALLK